MLELQPVSHARHWLLELHQSDHSKAAMFGADRPRRSDANIAKLSLGSTHPLQVFRSPTIDDLGPLFKKGQGIGQ